ncbi:MAG: hypothetical protein OXI83_14750 [Gemmatimonadota bacterium]|nr:hypothetical protein [Gemmatimonadota bacterium]
MTARRDGPVSGPAADSAPGLATDTHHFVGVDGGGTRSRALVGDAHGRELGAADGGPGLIDPADPAHALAAVTAVVRAAAVAANVPLPVAGLWAGLAGAGETQARTAVEAALRRAGLAERVAVGTDVEAAHADAFGARLQSPGGVVAGPGPAAVPGILCVVGTGSSVRAVGPRGEVVQVGGWGQLLGDEGSGYRIGLDGLRAVMRASDGREPRTSLSAAVLDAVGAAEPRDLVGWAARATKGEIAALSVLVAAEARNGDPVAARIVHRALGAIRAHLKAALERTPGWGQRPEIAFVGGLVREGSVLREAVTAIAAELGCGVHTDPVVPERGALRTAIHMAGG